VQNFSPDYLLERLSTCGYVVFTPIVKANLLSLRAIRSLSTISFFGAKLISLYLFLAFFREKLHDNIVIYAQYQQSGRGVTG
jgi:hypothetical protein